MLPILLHLYFLNGIMTLRAMSRGVLTVGYTYKSCIEGIP